jgi:hypothetical protein
LPIFSGLRHRGSTASTSSHRVLNSLSTQTRSAHGRSTGRRWGREPPDGPVSPLSTNRILASATFPAHGRAAPDRIVLVAPPLAGIHRHAEDRPVQRPEVGDHTASDTGSTRQAVEVGPCCSPGAREAWSAQSSSRLTVGDVFHSPFDMANPARNERPARSSCVHHQDPGRSSPFRIVHQEGTVFRRRREPR